MKKLDLICPFISGVGVISGAGLNCHESMERFYDPAKRILPAKASARCGTTLSDPVFELADLETEGINRNNMLANIAIKEALKNADLTEKMLENRRVGVCLGTTTAGQLNSIPLYAQLRNSDYSRIDKVKEFVNTNPAELLLRQYKLNGPALTISNACASGTDAAGIAQYWLSAGKCDIVLVIGVDELNIIPVAGFHALGVSSDFPCMPFDKKRTGLNLGEGAGCCIFENPLHAAKRGFSANTEFCAYGNACDAYHATSPHPEGEGLEKAIRAALLQAGLQPEDIAFVNAHGTSTRANDLCESKVFHRVFGKDVPFLSTKGWTGHTLGAAGTLELAFTVLMLQEGRIPGSCNFTEADPEMPAAPCSCEMELKNPEYALSDSLAFGGSNAAAVIRRRA